MSPLPPPARSMLYIPDNMADWPWPRVMNPHHEEISAASDAWFKSFRPFNDKSQHAFDLCDIGASLCFV